MNQVFQRDSIDDMTVYFGAVADLRRRGKRLVGHCPLHQEKTPSFMVDPDKKLFYCHGCGTGGDAVTLTMLLHKVNFVEATKKLGAWRNITPEEKERLWRERWAAARARRQREYFGECERELFLEIRRNLLLLESIARSSVRLLGCVDDPETTEILGETLATCSTLIREFSAGFTLMGFGPLAAKLDYIKNPQNRHRWHQRVLWRGWVRDDRGRAKEIIL